MSSFWIIYILRKRYKLFFLFSYYIREWRESYQEIDESTYSQSLLQAVLALGSSRQQNCALSDETTTLFQLRQQLAKVCSYKINNLLSILHCYSLCSQVSSQQRRNCICRHDVIATRSFLLSFQCAWRMQLTITSGDDSYVFCY